MVDFSEAERVGFILAFVEFWSLRPGNEHTTEQLNEAATSLLKGCLQHFRSGIARVKRISGVIPRIVQMLLRLVSWHFSQPQTVMNSVLVEQLLFVIFLNPKLGFNGG